MYINAINKKKKTFPLGSIFEVTLSRRVLLQVLCRSRGVHLRASPSIQAKSSLFAPTLCGRFLQKLRFLGRTGIPASQPQGFFHLP